mmetsp:Transcript_36500/g.82776  ORF Transcript_36500/g.82776 Transcript_36500/m.82776 type:complete len:213 (+) Transcript_36500:420-1058(+)
MVPGPAFVTNMSAAPMYSSMLFTKPNTVGSKCCLDLVFVGQSWSLSFLYSSSFRPQMTTSCPTSSDAICAPTAVAMSNTAPKPSPPPITRATSLSGTRSNAFRSSPFELRSASQKPCRTGRPHTTIFSRSNSYCMASSEIVLLGTNRRSTRGSNHERCAEPRSVTTVATCTHLLLPKQLKASMIRWLIKGCTEIIKSTPLLSSAFRNSLILS